MIKGRFSLSICLFVFSSHFLSAQFINQNFELISMKDGLLSNNISSIIQDQEGFIWIGSSQGLQRYDGARFKNYLPNPNNKNSIQFSEVTALFEDKEGIIWAGFKGVGISYYDKKTGIFKNFLQEQGEAYKHVHNTTSFYEDKNGRLWVAHIHGISSFDKETEEFRNYSLVDGEENINYVFVIFEDDNNNLWNSSYMPSKEINALNKYDAKLDSFIYTPEIKINSKKNNEPIFYSYKINSDQYIGSRNSVYRIQGTTNNSLTLSEKKLSEIDMKNIIHVNNDYNNHIWVNCHDRLYLFDNEWQQLENFYILNYEPIRTTINQQISIQYGIRTGSIFTTQNGLVWITTPRGLVKYNEPSKPFKDKPFELEDIKENYVTTIESNNNGDLWIGTKNGLIFQDKKTKKIKQYKHISGDEKSLIDNEIRKVLKDKEGTIWVGTINGLNKIIKKENGSVEFQRINIVLNDSLSLLNCDIRDIIEDESGRLWMPLNFWSFNKHIKKIGFFNKQKNRFYFLEMDIDWSIDVHSIVERKDGEIWLIGHRGLMKIELPLSYTSDETFKVNKVYDFEQLRLLKENPIWEISSVYFDDSDNIWIGTLGRGLYKWKPDDLENKDEDKLTITNYRHGDGLSSDNINVIEADLNGNLWIGTDQGLNAYNPNTDFFTGFSESNGLISKNFGLFHSKHSIDGRIILGTDKGIVSFEPDSILKYESPPPVVITNFIIHEENTPLKQSERVNFDEYENNSIELDYDQNYFTIEFAALDFNSLKRNEFKYKLDGLDEEWIESGENKFARYLNLKPGKYTFRVETTNNQGIWSDEEAILTIILHPPWWKTIFAYTIYVLAFILSVFGFIHLRTRRLEKQKLELMEKVRERTSELERRNKQIIELDKLKTRFFSNISHEFKTPLTLIIAPLENMLKDNALNGANRKKIEMMYRNSIRLLGLINQLLDLSKIDAKSLKLELIEYDITKWLKILTKGFFAFAEQKNIEYKIDIPKGSKVTFFDCDKIEKILTNLLSNAFKFTPEKGKISCKINFLEPTKNRDVEHIQFIIEDSGPGISNELFDKIFDRFYQVESTWQRALGGTGLGLSLTKELISLQHGKITVEHGNDSGCRFKVLIPIGKSHLKQNEYVIISPDEISKYNSFSYLELRNEENEEDEENDKKQDKDIVLIIDDNEDIRTLVKDSLAGECVIYEAKNGTEGINMAKEHIPDLIISDWVMPEMDGVELCKRIKNDELTSHIPFILLTVKSSVENKIEGLDIGADDYITKPFNSTELYLRVKNLLEQRKKLMKKINSYADISPNEISISSADKKFLERAHEVIENNIADFDFDIATFYTEMGMSRMQLFRKIKAITNQTPNDLIRNYRLKRAEQLIKQKYGNIAEITYAVGFNTPSYFAKCFKDKYAVSPSEYIKMNQTKSKSK